MEVKNVRRGRIHEVSDKFADIEFVAGQRPWSVKADIALPCATQNELNGMMKQKCLLTTEQSV